MSFNRAVAVVLTAPFAICLCLAVRADGLSDATKVIRAIYAKRDAAEAKKDLQGSLYAVTPDFTFVTKDGQKGDIGLLKRRLAPLISLVQSIKSKSTVEKVTLHGSQATAIVKSHAEMLVVDPQTQSPQRLVADGSSIDLWTKTPKGWLQRRMTSTAEALSLNGKSVTNSLMLNDEAHHPARAGGSKKSKTSHKGA